MHVAPSLHRGLTSSREAVSSGAVVLAVEHFTTPAVAISLVLQAGSIHDPLDRPGVANFVARLIDRGTATRSAESIADELDGRGISLGVAVSRHTLSLMFECLAEDFESALDLMADMIRHPAFDAEQVEMRRSEILAGIVQDEEAPASVASDALSRMLYHADHPYAWPSRGTVESVARIDREALLEHHRTRFGPGTATLAVVGAVPAEQVLLAASRLLGDWDARTAVDPSLPRPLSCPRRMRVVPMMGKAQAEIAYGLPGVARLDPDYYAFEVMNNVLGEYGMGGRIGENIRERQGLAYHASSTLYANVGVGPLIVRAGVDPGDVDRAIATIDIEVARMRDQGITSAELDAACRYLVGAIPRSIETNARIAVFLQTAEQFGLGLDLDRRLPELYRGVTLEQVHAAARRILDPERAAIVVAGPYSTETATLDR
jgi:zinc protease